MKLKFLMTFSIICSLALTGCATEILAGHDTIISTKSLNINSKKLVRGEKVIEKDETEGFKKSVAYKRTAINKALETNPCAVALVDTVYKINSSFSKAEYIVEGNLLLDKELPGCN